MQQTATPIIVQAPKSTALGLVLAFFFGPLGMLYSTIPGALTMFGINLVLIFFGFLTVGIGFFLLPLSWMAGMVWSAMAIDQHNKALSAGIIRQ